MADVDIKSSVMLYPIMLTTNVWLDQSHANWSGIIYIKDTSAEVLCSETEMCTAIPMPF